MKPQTFIFIGRSGSGKGTQADLLQKYIQSAQPQATFFRLETGKRFRDFIQKKTYTSGLSKELYDVGDIQPEFLAIAMWANSFMEDLKSEDHIILDGCPRKRHEAEVLDSAMKFYKRAKPHIICVNVSEAWARQRLAERHRLDDNDKEISVRLSWYETQVKPTIDFYRDNSNYHFIEINGEQARETVHKDILAAIGLDK